MTFLIPVILFNLTTAIIVSVIWGIALLGLFSYKIARMNSSSPWKAVVEHIFLLLVVLVITNFIGVWVSSRI